MSSIKRMESVTELVDGIRVSYPNAKKLKLDIHFEWVETSNCDSELCPIVKIEVEM